jgi:hypothetical protein
MWNSKIPKYFHVAHEYFAGQPDTQDTAVHSNLWWRNCCLPEAYPKVVVHFYIGLVGSKVQMSRIVLLIVSHKMF